MDCRFPISYCQLLMKSVCLSRQSAHLGRCSTIDNWQWSLLLLVLVPGCHNAKYPTHARQDTSSMSEMVFLHYLATAPTVSVGEGKRAIAMLLPEADADVLTRDSWDLSDGDLLDKGTLAYMLRTACRLPRGVNEAVFADTLGWGDRRYALKTCTYEGIMPYGRADEPVTGGELLSALRAPESNKNCRPSTANE